MTKMSRYELDQHALDTEWIRQEARRIADNSGRAYHLILFRGLQAYREGCDDEQIVLAMQDAVHKQYRVQGHGTG